MKTILLNPGPVTLSQPVRDALQRPDLCHRESEFADLQSGLRRKLLDVYALPQERWAAVLLTGSGTAAVEAMIASCVPTDGRLLIVENGVYGERMRRMAETYSIAHDTVTTRWGEAINIQSVAEQFTSQDYTHVAVVHHETTTGRLNDLSALAELASAHGASLLIDGVSSFGAELIDFERWPIAACAATANKCLHGVPGTAFVIADRAALGHARPARSVYLDLAEYLAKQDSGGTPFTQSVQTFYALDAALNEFFEAGGWRARQALFQERIGAVRAHLATHGVDGLLPLPDCSCVLHAFELPTGRDYSSLHDALKARGFIIYAGQGALSARVFRISAMGDITADDLDRLLEALSDVLSA